MNTFKLNKGFFALVLAGLTGIAQAQPSDGTSADELISAAVQALQKIDEDHAGELWDATSAFVKAAKPREQFVGELRRGRGTVGAVRQRNWASVTRIRYVEGSVTPPPGQYANVDFATHLADGRTVFEKVSFRLEPQGWRLTGYEPRQNQ